MLNAFSIFLSLYLLFICIFSFLYSSYGPIVSLTGLRLFVLSIIPINIILTPPRELSISVTSNALIVVFYMLFCTFSFIFNFNSYPSIHGLTFLGPRYPFLYEGPIPACLAFGSFSCFILLCHLIHPKRANTLIVYHAITLFFNLITGGRSGLIVSLFADRLNFAYNNS